MTDRLDSDQFNAIESAFAAAKRSTVGEIANLAFGAGGTPAYLVLLGLSRITPKDWEELRRLTLELEKKRSKR